VVYEPVRALDLDQWMSGQGLQRRFRVMVPGFAGLAPFIRGSTLLATVPGLLQSHLLRGLATIVWQFPRLTPAERDRHVQAWAAAMLLRLGVTLEIAGQPPVIGPMLLVCNHVSWLDIIVLHAAHHCRFVSKADVGRWPIVGRLATGAGTLYIERSSRRDAMRVVHDMVQALRERGRELGDFPLPADRGLPVPDQRLRHRADRPHAAAAEPAAGVDRVPRVDERRRVVPRPPLRPRDAAGPVRRRARGPR